MQLQKIKSAQEAFTVALRQPRKHNAPEWATIQSWQTHWQPNAPDLPAMYDRCLHNPHTRRLWKHDGYDPKRMMMEFMALEPDFAKTMFADLFNETKDPHARADRFVFYCDQLMAQYRQAFPLRNDTSHYHDDNYRMVSLYLGCRFPQDFAAYDPALFVALLPAIGAAPAPNSGDYPRYLKVMPTLYKILRQDDALWQAHQARLQDGEYRGEALQLALDFARFVVNGQLL